MEFPPHFQTPLFGLREVLLGQESPFPPIPSDEGPTPGRPDFFEMSAPPLRRVVLKVLFFQAVPVASEVFPVFLLIEVLVPKSGNVKPLR